MDDNDFVNMFDTSSDDDLFEFVPRPQHLRYVLSKRKIHSVLTCLDRFKVPGIRASPLGTIGDREAVALDRGFEKHGWFRHEALTTYVENHPVARQTYSELVTEDNSDALTDALTERIQDAAAVFDADGNTMDYLADDFQLVPGMEVHFKKFKPQRRKKYLDAVAMDFQHHFERSMDDATFDVHEFVMVHCSKDEIFENVDGYGKDELKGVLQRWQAAKEEDLEQAIEFRYATEEEVRTRTRRQLLLVYFIYLLTNHEQFQA
jgi:hypothetical protein